MQVIDIKFDFNKNERFLFYLTITALFEALQGKYKLIIRY